MSVILTEKAARQFQSILSRAGFESGFLKLGVRNGGCAGMSYTMDVVPEAPENFMKFDCLGISVVMDADHKQYLDGLTLDYNDDILNSGFKWFNPNASETCGCGSSFAAGKRS